MSENYEIMKLINKDLSEYFKSKTEIYSLFDAGFIVEYFQKKYFSKNTFSKEEILDYAEYLRIKSMVMSCYRKIDEEPFCNEILLLECSAIAYNSIGYTDYSKVLAKLAFTKAKQFYDISNKLEYQEYHNYSTYLQTELLGDLCLICGLDEFAQKYYNQALNGDTYLDMDPNILVNDESWSVCNELFTLTLKICYKELNYNGYKYNFKENVEDKNKIFKKII